MQIRCSIGLFLALALHFSFAAKCQAKVAGNSSSVRCSRVSILLGTGFGDANDYPGLNLVGGIEYRLSRKFGIQFNTELFLASEKRMYRRTYENSGSNNPIEFKTDQSIMNFLLGPTIQIPLNRERGLVDHILGKLEIGVSRLELETQETSSSESFTNKADGISFMYGSETGVGFRLGNGITLVVSGSVTRFHYEVKYIEKVFIIEGYFTSVNALLKISL